MGTSYEINCKNCSFKKEVNVSTFNQLLDESRLEEILHKEKLFQEI